MDNKNFVVEEVADELNPLEELSPLDQLEVEDELGGDIDNLLPGIEPDDFGLAADEAQKEMELDEEKYRKHEMDKAENHPVNPVLFTDRKTLTTEEERKELDEFREKVKEDLDTQTTRGML